MTWSSNLAAEIAEEFSAFSLTSTQEPSPKWASWSLREEFKIDTPADLEHYQAALLARRVILPPEEPRKRTFSREEIGRAHV